MSVTHTRAPAMPNARAIPHPKPLAAPVTRATLSLWSFIVNSFRIADLPPSAVSLHDPFSAHALRQVLIWRPDADFLDGRVPCCDVRRGGQGVVGLQLGHGPHRRAHGRNRLLQRVELRKERAVDAIAGLIARPETVTEGLDDVIGRH